MDLRRLFDPRSVAVVGASDREGSYGGQTLVNLRTLGYEGDVWPVNPRRDRVHGLDCFPSLAELPGAPDAVVVAVPAASVPEVIADAGRLGCGGAVVYGAGFAEIEDGRSLQDELVEAAGRHELPVCGPNGNGIVVFPRRVAIWGDALSAREHGDVAIVSQSGNQAVNALSNRRGLRFHTVVSCGNQAVLEAADFLHHLADEGEVRSVALNLEADGDGARLCEALAACADAGIGVAVLKVGSSQAGASAAAAHTGAVAGDQRVFSALLAEAGAVPVTDPHDLLEVAKTLAARRASHQARDLQADRAGTGGTTEGQTQGLAVMTCSGGDSSAAADEADRRGLSFPPFSAETERRLAGLVPHAATVANPLDYTAMIWGERKRLAEMIAAVADDPGVGRVLVFYDEPGDLEGDPKSSWEAVREGILDGARASSVPVVVSSTLPELLQDDSAARFYAAGVPAIAGLRSGILCATALTVPRGDATRLREIASFSRRASRQGPRDLLADRAPGSWLPEHGAKDLLKEAGVPVVEGRVARDEDDAVAILAELGPPVAAKLSGEDLRHKSELGALALELVTEVEVRDAHGRLLALRSGSVLIERHAPPGVELLVSVRRTGVVPSLAIGLGGVWTEALDDVVVVPLPATPERVERSLRELRGSALLTGGRGRPPLDVGAVARLAASAGDVLLDAGLELLELNPVVVYEDGASVLDALARTTAPSPQAAAVSQ
ncbi:MAG TPA: acetate--CoA ligase family protein [Solirubrobacterales bacterium]|nr:acetate--CoA ligase family protein [Solirubrobacterales bacterium]